MTAKTKKYIPEIDGLRAFAVLIVLMFHLNPNGLLTGGFIGVDIFFVISGFLITGILFNSIERKTFSYWSFISRRISRLYPALLLVVFIVLLFVFLSYGTKFYETVGQTSKYTLISISNTFFAKKGGYWDTDSIENPLLHTWSLGVEQQFYLIWPFIVLFTVKFIKKINYQIFFLAIIACLSFVIAQKMSVSNPNKNFYFTISRIFELTTGGMLALYFKKNNTLSANIPNLVKEIILGISLLILIFCAIFYSDSMGYHPGSSTIPVIIASVLVIYASSAKYLGSILRNKIAVFIGLISYSIYLIHWPLIVFYRYVFLEPDLTLISQIILFSTTVILGCLLYYMVENRFRNISLSFFKKSGLIFIFILTFLMSWSLVIHKTNFMNFRLVGYSQEIVHNSLYAQELPDYFHWSGNPSVYGDKSRAPSAIFIGDSYLGQYIKSIDEYFKHKNMSVIVIGQHGCLFLKDIFFNIQTENCMFLTDYYDKFITNNSLPIIRINNWSLIDRDDFVNANSDRIKPSQNEIFEELERQAIINQNRMLLILPPPYYPLDFNPEGKPILMNTSDSLFNKNSDLSRIENLKKIKTEANKLQIPYIETYDILFDRKDFASFVDEKTGYHDYSYDGHLSISGAKKIWDEIGDQVYEFILDGNK